MIKIYQIKFYLRINLFYLKYNKSLNIYIKFTIDVTNLYHFIIVQLQNKINLYNFLLST